MKGGTCDNNMKMMGNMIVVESNPIAFKFSSTVALVATRSSSYKIISVPLNGVILSNPLNCAEASVSVDEQ